MDVIIQVNKEIRIPMFLRLKGRLTFLPLRSLDEEDVEFICENLDPKEDQEINEFNCSKPIEGKNVTNFKVKSNEVSINGDNGKEVSVDPTPLSAHLSENMIENNAQTDLDLTNHYIVFSKCKLDSQNNNKTKEKLI